MLTSKQRSKLKALAANLSPIGQVGKDGIGENMLKSFSDCLESRELIKINILENADGDPHLGARTCRKTFGRVCHRNRQKSRALQKIAEKRRKAY